MHQHASGPRESERVERATAADLTALLNDDHARTILRATREEPRPARELVEHCECSRPTVYRRLDQLRASGLVEESVAYDPDGHHRHVYRSTVEQVTFSLDGDGLSAVVP